MCFSRFVRHSIPTKVLNVADLRKWDASGTICEEHPWRPMRLTLLWLFNGLFGSQLNEPTRRQVKYEPRERGYLVQVSTTVVAPEMDVVSTWVISLWRKTLHAMGVPAIRSIGLAL
jgi:hypothetical protein